MIGDWMGSIYGISGGRSDYHLFLDHDNRYERSVRKEPNYEANDAGRWEYDETRRVLRLVSDSADGFECASGEWWVLSVATCEESNVMLILREAVLASRNLPIIFYRVHHRGRGYGTDWEKRLPAKKG